MKHGLGFDSAAVRPVFVFVRPVPPPDDVIASMGYGLDNRPPDAVARFN